MSGIVAKIGVKLMCDDCDETVIHMGTRSGFVFTCDCEDKIVPEQTVAEPSEGESEWRYR